MKMKLRNLLEKVYIPATTNWKETYSNLSKIDDLWDWIPMDKISVRKIKVGKDFPNEANDNDVTYMINNFYEDAWDSIVVDENYYLLDGRHRLTLAERAGFKYIDVIVKKKKDAKVTQRMRERLKMEQRHQKEMERIFGFTL
jgi:hypothetical protein